MPTTPTASATSGTASGKRTPKHALLPANDPNRVDIQYFRDILQEPTLALPEGATEAEAAVFLKDCLRRAHATAFESLFRTCGKRSAVVTGLMEDANAAGKRGFYQDLFRSGLIDQNLGRVYEAGSIIKIKDPEKGYSGNAIEYWDPTRHGIVAYMTNRLNYIGYAITEMETNGWARHSVRTTSLEQFRESSGQEPREDGTWANLKSGNVIEDESEIAPPAGANKTEERELSEAEEIRQGNLGRFDSIYARLVNASDLDSPARAEYTLFALAGGRHIDPLDSPEARCVQLRTIAEELLKAREDVVLLDEDRAANVTIEDLCGDVRSWDPSMRSFSQAFPEITDLLFNELRNIENEKYKETVDNVSEMVQRRRHLKEVREEFRSLKASLMAEGPALGQEDSPEKTFLEGVTATRMEQVTPESLKAHAELALDQIYTDSGSTKARETVMAAISAKVAAWDPATQHLGVAVPEIITKGESRWKENCLTAIMEAPKVEADQAALVDAGDPTPPPARVSAPGVLAAIKMLTREIPVRDLGAERAAKLASREMDFWNVRCADPEDLKSPDRPDLVYLEAIYGEHYDPRESPEVMHQAIRELAGSFAADLSCTLVRVARDESKKSSDRDQLRDVGQAIGLLQTGLDTYQPDTDGFVGEYIMDVLTNPSLVIQEMSLIHAQELQKAAAAQGQMNVGDAVRPVKKPDPEEHALRSAQDDAEADAVAPKNGEFEFEVS